ncbi:MAG: hypothetical protein KatS3mg013_2150 [Actinomycetota bacterium]|nr:MAG: hypothetical protein KatS3mg013_2150 [Actinomycetota bacterium]
MEVERSIELPVSQARAWAFLVDWERQADWMLDADRVRVLTSERSGVGVRLAVPTRVLGLPLLEERLEVVVWDPPRRLVVAHRRFVAGEGEWRLDPASSGGTRFSWREELRLPIPVLGPLALLAYRPVLGALMARSMHRLRRLVIAAGPAVRPTAPEEGRARSG